MLFVYFAILDRYTKSLENVLKKGIIVIDYYEVNNYMICNKDKINYLNQIMQNKDKFIYNGPKSLYKYRPFDEYTFDMLENKYVYLCPAEKEDDETECLTTVDFERLFDLETNNLKKECLNQVIEFIRPYLTEKNYEIEKNKILSIARQDGTVPANCMLDLSLELQAMAPEGIDIAPFVNWIVGINFL